MSLRALTLNAPRISRPVCSNLEKSLSCSKTATYSLRRFSTSQAQQNSNPNFSRKKVFGTGFALGFTAGAVTGAGWVVAQFLESYGRATGWRW